MLSAALPDKPDPVISEPIAKQVETVPLVTETDEAKPEAKVKVPVHAMQSNWSAQKRLKKLQVETLERVYSRTKRPTVSISSLKFTYFRCHNHFIYLLPLIACLSASVSKFKMCPWVAFVALN